MSATERAALPAASVDMSRLSLVSSTPTADAVDEVGSLYDARTLAAGRLVHTHALDDTHFLALFSTVWTDATYDQDAPGVVTAKTVVDTPVACWVDTNGGGARIAELSTAPGRLVSATSFGHMLFVLGTAAGYPALFSYRVATFGNAGGVDLVGSEWLQSVQLPTALVKWDRGIYQSGRYTYIVGADAANRLYFQKRMLVSTVQVPLYLGAKGWSADPGELTPIRDAYDLPVTAVGPVSVVRYGTEWYLAAGTRPGTETVVWFWRASNPRMPFHRLPETVNLGTAAGSTVAYFQESVHPNPQHTALANTGALSGLPYVASVESASSLRTTWGLVAVPRSRL